MRTRRNDLQALIADLDSIIAAAKNAKLHETAALLRIARLDLLMRAHGIKPDELELVSFALARSIGDDDPPAKPRRRKRH